MDDPHNAPPTTMTDDWQLSDQPSHEEAASLFAYWKSKKSDTDIPLRSAVDFTDIPSLLSHTGLLEVENTTDSQIRFRVRFFGPLADDIAGEQRTGQLLCEFGEDLPETIRKDVIGRWQNACLAVYHSGRPIFTQGIRRNPAKTHQRIHAAALPLTTDGTTVSHVLGFMLTELANSTK